MMLLRISSIGALFLVLTHPTEGAKLAGTDLSLETRPILETRSESLEGCGMSSLSKCYGILPPDGSTSSNLIEEIGQVSDAKKCQIFCKDLYHGTCNWFMFDRTTNDCMLFSGSLEDLQGDCREVGYAKEPNHASCDTVFPSNSSDGCYNFREDYCRFDFSLLENLDDIDSLSECQLACEYVSNCSYFLYDNPSKTCKLYTEESIQRTCDIIHGTPEPDINTCIEQGKISWAAQATVTTGQPTATDQPTEEASSTTVAPANTTTSTTTVSTTAPTTTIATTTEATTGSEKILSCANKKIALKAFNGKYVTVDLRNGAMKTNQDNVGPNEIFTFDKLESGKFTIKAENRYVKAENRVKGYWSADYGQRNYRVLANSGSTNSWQQFEILNQDDGTIVLKTAHGRYIGAGQYVGGTLRENDEIWGDSRSITARTKFTPECE